MRILYIDIDALRPDHLGCYGYHRNTSPNIDQLAQQATRFTNCYASDVPCLPSRTAFVMGRPGIHTGVVNHGGTASEPFPIGPGRGFSTPREYHSIFQRLRKNGWHTAAITPFPERHAAWHFRAGLHEHLDSGRSGHELADEVNKLALPWLEQHAKDDQWFLYLNYWDVHRTYRVPESYGNPFENDPPPAWMTEQIRAQHWRGRGMQCAHDPNDGTDNDHGCPRMPREISSMDEYKRWVDGYDVAIRYMDDHLGQVLDLLENQGVLEDTAIIITADHGENMGELNHYGAHRTGDHVTCNLPLIMRWPGVAQQGGVKHALHYHYDVAATILDLTGNEIPEKWHGESFAASLRGEEDAGRDYLVCSQLACMAQRCVRFDDWLLIRTHHDGFTGFPPIMLFNMADDPHELNDLSAQRPDIVERGLAKLHQWHAHMMQTHPAPQPIDPLQTVLREHPFHASPRNLANYLQRLRDTGRGDQADELERYRGFVDWPD